MSLHHVFILLSQASNPYSWTPGAKLIANLTQMWERYVQPPQPFDPPLLFFSLKPFIVLLKSTFRANPMQMIMNTFSYIQATNV